jgi:excinuclease ABC subunit C
VTAAGLALPFVDTDRLRRRVAALAENRPGTYRMLDAAGRVIYVGKAKRVRTRLLSYFRARFPDDKAARIVAAAHDLDWDYAPSEFAASLSELRQIRRFRPPFNIQMNRPGRAAFVKLADGPAPKIFVGATVGSGAVRHYGPFRGGNRLREAVRVLNIELGLRDCALNMPIAYAEQGDLFRAPRRAACIRYELGTCLGPCGGFVREADYQARVEVARAFLEGRAIAPLDRIVTAMTEASEAAEFEDATRLRDRYEMLEWLFAAGSRIRAGIEALSFVYVDPGTYGDDRAYVIRRATVRASAPAPHTPIERAAFRALVEEHAGAEPTDGALPPDGIDEMVLLLGWFRRHPTALRRTVPIDEWLDTHKEPGDGSAVVG